MRIGLIGCGRWGRLILRDLVALGAKVSVVDTSEACRASASVAGAITVHAEITELVDMDGYVVAVPSAIHADVIKILLPLGRPLFVEKPLTCNAESAADIARIGPDQVFSMDKWRYHGGVVKLADLVRSNTLGRIMAVHTSRLGWGNPHQDVDATWILMPHDLSIVKEILGYLPRVKSATGYRCGNSDASLIAVLADSENEAIVTCEISSLNPFKRRSVVVVGAEGSAQFDDACDNCIRYCPPEGNIQDISVESEMPLVAELRAFLSYLKGGSRPKGSVSDAALIVARIEEARRHAGF